MAKCEQCSDDSRSYEEQHEERRNARLAADCSACRRGPSLWARPREDACTERGGGCSGVADGDRDFLAELRFAELRVRTAQSEVVCLPRGKSAELQVRDAAVDAPALHVVSRDRSVVDVVAGEFG